MALVATRPRGTVPGVKPDRNNFSLNRVLAATSSPAAVWFLSGRSLDTVSGESGQRTRHRLAERPRGDSSLTLSPCGRYLAVLGNLQLYQVDDQGLTQIHRHLEITANAACFVYAAGTAAEGTDPRAEPEVHLFLPAQAFNKSYWVVDVRTGDCYSGRETAGSTVSYNNAAVSPDQARVALVGDTNAVTVLNVRRFGTPYEIDTRHRLLAGPHSIANNQAVTWLSTNLVAVGLLSGLVAVFDVTTGAVVAEREYHDEEPHPRDCGIVGLELHPAGRVLLFTAYSERKACLWALDWQDPTSKRQLVIGADLYGFAVSPCGHSLWTCQTGRRHPLHHYALSVAGHPLLPRSLLPLLAPPPPQRAPTTPAATTAAVLLAEQERARPPIWLVKTAVVPALWGLWRGKGLVDWLACVVVSFLPYVEAEPWPEWPEEPEPEEPETAAGHTDPDGDRRVFWIGA